MILSSLLGLGLVGGSLRGVMVGQGFEPGRDDAVSNVESQQIFPRCLVPEPHRPFPVALVSFIAHFMGFADLDNLEFVCHDALLTLCSDQHRLREFL